MLKVKCIDNKDTDLILNQVYQVAKEGSLDYWLSDFQPNLGWLKTRFMIVGGLQVKCINNAGRSDLIINHIYNVVGENGKRNDGTYTDWILDTNHSSCLKTRFEIVKSSAPASGVAVNDHTCPTCKNTRCSKSEKTCWLCGNLL